MANLNFNKVIIGGRLTSDPELKTTPNGTMVTSFSVAVNRSANKEMTDFFNVTAWRNNAEFIAKYFKKGSSIMITGHLENRSWNDADGKKRYATDIIAEEVSFVDSKNEQAVATPESDPSPVFEDLNDDPDLPF